MTARTGTPQPQSRVGAPVAARSSAGVGRETQSPVRRPPDPGSGDAGPIVVARNARFDGLLTFRGQARIEGELRGQVFCRGTLRLGPEALVTGVVDADELVVGGRLQGEATARRRIELAPTARVEGVLRAPRLALADGCQLEGRCETLPAPTRADR